MKRSWLGSLGILTACFACAGKSDRNAAGGDDAGADAGEGVDGSGGTTAQGGGSVSGSDTGGADSGGSDNGGGTGMGGRSPGTGGMAGSRAGSGGSVQPGGTGGSSGTPFGGAGNAGVGGVNAGTGGVCGTLCSGGSGGGVPGGDGNTRLNNVPTCPVQANPSPMVSIPPIFECAPDPNQPANNPPGCYYNSTGCLCMEGLGGAFCQCVHPDSACATTGGGAAPGVCQIGVAFSTIPINYCGCSIAGTFYCTIV